MIFGKGKKICAKMDIFFVRRRRRQNYMKLQGMELLVGHMSRVCYCAYDKIQEKKKLVL